MTEKQYNSDNTDAATLAAFVALGSEIAALRWEVQNQRERADEYQRELSKLRLAYDVLSSDSDELLDKLNAAERGATNNETATLERAAAIMTRWGILRVRREGDTWHVTSEQTHYGYRGNTLVDAIITMRSNEEAMQP